MIKKPKSKKDKVTICPPAIADGVTTTAEVKPIKRPRGQGPRKLTRKFPKVKERKGRVKKWVDLDPIVKDKPKLPQHRRWCPHSRRILNEQKDRMIRRKRLSVSDRKRLEAANKRRLKRLRQRLRDLVNSGITFD